MAPSSSKLLFQLSTATFQTAQSLVNESNKRKQLFASVSTAKTGLVLSLTWVILLAPWAGQLEGARFIRRKMPWPSPVSSLLLGPLAYYPRFPRT